MRIVIISLSALILLTSLSSGVEYKVITNGEEIYLSNPDLDLLKADDLTALGWYYHFSLGDNERAKTLFVNSLHRNPADTDALEGLFIIEFLMGNMNDAFDYLIELNNNDINAPRALSYLSHLNLFEDTTKRYEEIHHILKANPPYINKNYCHHLRYEYLNLDIFFKLGDSPLYHSIDDIKNNTCFLSEWKVTGPFLLYGKTDFNYKFPPERKLSKDKYKWNRNIYTWEDTSPDVEGYIFIEDLLQSGEGCAYAKCELDATQGDYYLVIESEQPIKLWINEQIIYDRNTFIKPGSVKKSFRIRLKDGKNTVLLKTVRNSGAYEIQDGGWRFRAQLFTTNDFEQREGDNLSFGEDWYWIDNEPFTNLYHALLEIYDGNECNAIDLLERLVDEYPEYPFFRIILIYALIKSGEDWQIKMARNELGTVITQMPDCLLAKEELAVYYQVEDKFNKSLDAYTSVIEENPSYLSAHLGLADLYLNQGYEKEFFNEIEYVKENYHDNARALASLIEYYIDKENYKTTNLLIRDYLSNRPYDWAYWEGLAKYQESAGDLNGAIRTYTYISQMLPMRTKPYLELARLYQRTGHEKNALRLYDEIINRFPRCSKAYLMKGLLLERQGENGINLIRTSLKMNPSDYWTRDYLRIIGGLEGERTPYDISFESDDINRVEQHEFPQADSVMLFNQMILELNDDYTFTETIHNLIQILNYKGRERWGEITIPGGKMTDIIEARTFMPDGRILEAISIKNINNNYVISMEGLVEGSVIEIKYRLKVDKRMIDDLNCFFSPTFTFADINMPYIKSQFVVSVPRWMDIYFPRERFRGKRDRIRKDDRIIYLFEMTNVEGIIPESMMPPLTEVAPLVYSTTLKGIDELSLWYIGEMWGKTYLDYRSRSFTHQLVSDCENDLEKAKRIYYWVMKSVKGYSGNIYYPLNASSTMYEKTGRAIDRAILLIGMLREVGIDAHLALVNTIYTEDEMWNHPTSSLVDMPLVYIPDIDGKSYYIDPNLEDITFGDYWSDNYGKRAILLCSDRYYETTIPVKPLYEDSFSLVGTFNIYPDGKLNAVGRKYFNGLRGTYRNLFRDPKERERLVEASLGQYFPYLTLMQVDFFNLDDLDGVFSYHFHFVEPNFGVRYGKTLRIPSVPGAYQLSSAFISSATRIQPMRFNRPETYKDDILIVPPPGFTFKTIPDDVHLKTKYTYYELTYHITDRGLRVKRILHIKGGTLPAESYPDFIEFCQEVDNCEKKYIELMEY